MDSLYQALSFYNRNRYDRCIEKCTEILRENAYDKAAWVLKMRALTESVRIDELEFEQENLADDFLNDNVLAEAARLGTSLRNVKPNTTKPKTEVGHILTGVIRTNLSSAHSKNIEKTLKSGRKMTSRPVTSQSGRYVRLGTASMLARNEETFIDISKINLTKYAMDISGQHLFDYLFYHDNDIQHALELAIEANKAYNFTNWWWLLQMGKCYYVLSMIRESEQSLKTALKLHVNIELFLRLIRIYKKLDQPLSALNVCKKALEIFPDEVSFSIEAARLHEALSDITTSVSCYQEVLRKDASNIEAIACIGVNYFYSDQPELALQFYKRLLQMGIVNAEVMNNIGLCCFYSQQYDVALPCFRRALALATNENSAYVWYNLSYIAIGIGDLNLARLCLRLCLFNDGNHALALNNLGVLEIKRNNLSHAKSYFMAAIKQAPFLFEPHFNYAKLTYECGELQTSYKIAEKALELSPSHNHCTELLNKLKNYFMQIQ